MEPKSRTEKQANRRGAWALWIGVVLLFLFVITAWTILINIARNNPVEQVELETSAQHPKSNTEH
jgi:hypothetical protein